MRNTSRIMCSRKVWVSNHPFVCLFLLEMCASELSILHTTTWTKSTTCLNQLTTSSQLPHNFLTTSSQLPHRTSKIDLRKSTSRTSQSVNTALLWYQNCSVSWMMESVVVWKHEKMETSRKEIEQQEDRFGTPKIRVKFEENTLSLDTKTEGSRCHNKWTAR